MDRIGPIRSQASHRCTAVGPSARVASLAMVPWPSGLKLSSEIGTHHGKIFANIWVVTL